MVSLPPFCVRTHFTYSSMLLAGVPPDTASTLAKVAKPATGTKSVAGLKPGFFTTCGRIEMVWSCDRNSVWPSAGEDFSTVAAICPPAPARFSTTTGTPSTILELFAQRACNGVGAGAGGEAHEQADGVPLCAAADTDQGLATSWPRSA